ncbi:MAG: hypothetical protein IPK26_25610 [Planctomycetes bacterium]|nr:hypothetical protein [Planctomycetota bacterium]
MSAPAGRSRERCPWCGARLSIVHVHGHGQCAACGTNVEPCCGGAGGEAGESPTLHPLDANPRLFERLFEGLGGPTATVAEDALVFALAQRLGVDLDEARLLIEAGVRTGRLNATAAHSYRIGTSG